MGVLHFAWFVPSLRASAARPCLELRRRLSQARLRSLSSSSRVPGRSSVCAVNEGLPRCFSARSSHDGEHGTSSETDIKRVRIEKAESLRGLGLEPYAYTFDRTAMATDLLREHESLAPGKEAGQGSSVRVAGRIRLRRVLGKLAFAQLQDESGTIQLYFDKRVVGAEGFQRLKQLIDIGDIIGAQGHIKRTEKGELSVVVSEWTMLTKSLLPLPDKWHGLSDVETRYRKRYIDMLVNPGVTATLRARSKTISTLRRVLGDQGFLEVETPVLETVTGGADARPFLTFHNSAQRQLSLRIATELHLKRLVVGGFERVFEIGRIFRNEGVSSRHNPEFTSVEVYQAYTDYHGMMTLTENIIRACAEAVTGSQVVSYQGTALDFSQPFRRATMHELVREATGIDFSNVEGNAAAKVARDFLENETRSGEDHAGALAALAAAPSPGVVVNILFEELVEKTLLQPTIVLDLPVEVSPLAKPHRTQQGLTERFELYIAGRELANSFSELTDPVEQRARLEQQVKSHAAARVAASDAGPDVDYDIQIDEDFLTALEVGLPPTGGMGMGIDRLVMLLTDSPSIRDVIAFPLMK